MLGLWLTTIGGLAIFFAALYFFFYFIKISLNSTDAKKVDPLPDKEHH